MTFSDLITLFKQRNPDFKDSIVDYRPSGLNSMRIQLKGGAIIEAVYVFDETNEEFIIK